MIWVSDSTWQLDSSFVPKRTLVAPVKPVPVMVRFSPPAVGPSVGLIEAIAVIAVIAVFAVDLELATRGEIFPCPSATARRSWTSLIAGSRSRASSGRLMSKRSIAASSCPRAGPGALGARYPPIRAELRVGQTRAQRLRDYLATRAATRMRTPAA
jgi:hypothetical protein